MTTKIKAGVIAANAITASELASSALSGGTFTGDVTFDTDTLVVDSANNRVGIGTDSPANKLNVVDTGSDAASFKAVGGYAVQAYQDATSANHTALDLRTDNVSGDDRYLIRGYADASGTPTENFRVAASGEAYFASNVGMGTNSPVDLSGQTSLTINGSVARVDLQVSQTTTGSLISESGYIHLKPASGGKALIGNGASDLVVDSSGNVGIDNNSPTATLHIGDSSSSTNSIGIQNSSRFYTLNNESGDLFIKDESAAAERLRITSSGDAQFKGNIAFTKQDGMTISGYESLVMQINSQNNQSSRVFQVNNYTTPLFIVHQTGIIDARLPFKFHSTTSDPSVTDQGSVYWNSTDKKFRYYTGSGWVNLTTPDLTAIPGLDVWADVTEGISGGTIADLSGNGVEGTPYDATNHIGTLGNNTYYNCNSSGGSWITYDRNDFNNYAGDVTLFFVMTNRSSLSSEGSFITQNYQAGVGYHIIRHYGTSDDFNVYASNVNNLALTSTNTAIPVNASYNEGVIIIFSIGTGTNWVIYKKENGSEGVDTFTSSTSATFNFNSNTNAIRIGNSQWAGEYLNAGIFAWGIIDHQITASERQIIYDYYARKGIAV